MGVAELLRVSSRWAPLRQSFVRRKKQDFASHLEMPVRRETSQGPDGGTVLDEQGSSLLRAVPPVGARDSSRAEKLGVVARGR